MIHRALGEIVLRERPRVLATLMANCGDLDIAEEAFQDACLRAHITWPQSGLPDKPGAWLQTVAWRRSLDLLRRRARSPVASMVQEVLASAASESLPPGSFDGEMTDERLRLVFTCCHPALPSAAQIALALRHICGLTTVEIARGFMEPETTTAQRLGRAKQKIRDAKIPYAVPEIAELPARVDNVLSIIYLLFNEGYAASDGDFWLRPDLSAEAIRLGRLLVELLPDNSEVHALLALMSLHHARRDGRLSAGGDLILLEDQDRSKWRSNEINAALKELDCAIALRQVGIYQLQAMIASLHATASSADKTDWRQIAAIYGALLEINPSPVIQLNAAVACAFAYGIEQGLRWMDRLDREGELSEYHLLPTAQAELLLRVGRRKEALAAYDRALALVKSSTERRHLLRRKSMSVEREGPGTTHNRESLPDQ